MSLLLISLHVRAAFALVNTLKSWHVETSGACAGRLPTEAILSIGLWSASPGFGKRMINVSAVVWQRKRTSSSLAALVFLSSRIALLLLRSQIFL